MTSLIAAIGEGSSVTADVSRYKELLYSNSLCFWDELISKNDYVFSLLPTFPPISPQFLPSATPENVFILSLNEDVSKQLGEQVKRPKGAHWARKLT